MILEPFLGLYYLSVFNLKDFAMRTGKSGYNLRPVPANPNQNKGSDKPKSKNTDILWITPTRLAAVFVIALTVTLYFNGV